MPQACPKPASFWAQACASPGTALTRQQIATVAGAVSRSVNSLRWPAGAEADSFCAAMNPAGGGDLRRQARREFAAFVANVCAGDSGIVTAAADTILLPRGIAASCPGVPEGSVGGLMTPGSLSPIATYGAYVGTVPPPLAGVPLGLESFGGGAGFASSLFPSALTPEAAPDSFAEVDVAFSHANPQLAYRYLRLERASDGSAPPQGRGFLYGGFRTVPFRVVKPSQLETLDVAFGERCLTDDAGTILPAAQQPATFDSTWAPDTSATGGHEWLVVLDQAYSAIPRASCQQDGALASGALPALYAVAARLAFAGAAPADGDQFVFQSFPEPSAGVDSLLLALALRPLADPAVQQLYQGLVTGLAAINSGASLTVPCGASTSALVVLLGASFVSDHVHLSWSATAGPGIHVALERREGTETWAALASRTSDAAGTIAYDDHAVVRGHAYEYRLTALGVVVAGDARVAIPARTSTILYGARPNPARGELDVAFELPSSGPARLQLFDLAGRKLRDRDVGALGPGFHLVRLNEGARVRVGVYVVRLTTQGGTVTRKAVVLR